MAQNLILRYWDAKVGHGNFGDELSPFVVQRLIDPSIKISFNSESVDGNDIPGFISIGSYLQYAAPGDYIWGSGIRTWPQLETPLHPLEAIASSLNIFALRGPLTREVLISLGARCADVPLGDPALLLSEFYQPRCNALSSDKIVVIPNVANYEYFAGCSLPSEYHLVSPYEKWADVVDSIWSSKLVVSSSLHGLILADTFGKPNVWISYPEPPEGFLKYLDYFLSQGRALECITNLDQLQSHPAVYDSGNRIDLSALKEAFPFSRCNDNSFRANDCTHRSRVDLRDDPHSSVLMSVVSLESIRISQMHVYKGADLPSVELQLQYAAMSQSVEDLRQQLSAQGGQLQEVEQARDEQVARVSVLEAEKAAAAQSVENLNQQLALQGGQLQEAQQARDQQAERVTALEAEQAAAAQSVDDLNKQLALQAQALEQLKAELAGKTVALAQAEAALSRVSGNLRQLVQR